MGNFYLDFENGNDANDGTTFANRWKTFAAGATAARTAPGDIIRIMASPDETLIGNVAWTNGSRSLTLPASVTQTVSNCDTAWTASSNVTSTTAGSNKEGTNCISLAIATAFTTGKAAYFATGALNLSGYQQLSFWIQSSVAVAASVLSLRLCSDTIGATTVNTILIPAIPAANVWQAVTVDLATNFGSSIQSIALYAESDPGVVTVKLDCILACKASGSADSLTLTSLIGKVHNRCWIASTAYSLSDIRKPSQPNRNGFRYRVTTAGTTGSSEPTWPLELGATVTDGSVIWTCDDIEEGWYPIQSISGTTVKMDAAVATGPNISNLTYTGTTETVATYKREPIKSGPSAAFNTQVNIPQEDGTAASPIIYSGGWNRTDMSTQTGETWLSGVNGDGYMVYLNARSHVEFRNLNGTRFNNGYILNSGCYNVRYTNVQLMGNTGDAIGYVANANSRMFGTGIVCYGNGNGIIPAPYAFDFRQVRTDCNSTGFSSNTTDVYNASYVRNIVSKNNSTGISHNGTAVLTVSNLVTSGNTNGAASALGKLVLINASIAETTEFAGLTTNGGGYIYSHKHDQTANNHLITADGGTIVSATDQRHTASGIAWKFRPTATNRSVAYPLELVLGKIACLSGVAVNITIWTRRDNANIKGQLVVRGGQLAGVPDDVAIDCQPTINTWEQSSTLSFTPTETGVLELVFKVWDGVGTTNAFWIDDIAFS